MTESQLISIFDWLNTKTETREAITAVIIDGLSAYAAEVKYNRPLRTVGRKVTQVRAAYAVCLGVAQGNEPVVNRGLKSTGTVSYAKEITA
jgi:hypothetical protein